MTNSEILAMERIQEYAEELNKNPQIVPSLFWAGKMATLGASMLRCDLHTVSGWTALLDLVIREYNTSILELNTLNLTEDFEKIAKKISGI